MWVRGFWAAAAAALAMLAALGAGTAHGAEARIWESRYDWAAGHGYSGWAQATHAADPQAYGFAAGFPDAPGLWVWPAGGREHRPGAAEWTLQAPGTTRLISASLDVSFAPKLFAHHCLEAGMRTASESRGHVLHCKPPHPEGEDHRVALALADPAALADVAWLGVRMPVCHNPADEPCSKHLPEHDPQTTGRFAHGTSVSFELVDRDLPTVTTSSDVRDRYVDGKGAHPVELEAADAGSGVRRTGLEREGAPPAQEAGAACDWTHRTPELGARICPATAAHTYAIDARELPEGAHAFKGIATDLSGHAAAEPAWHVFVDRTAPAAPAEFELDLDEETDTALVTWVEGEDPVLADGTPGSGTGDSEHRFWHPRLGWSDWHRGAQTVEIPDSLQGDTIKLEARNADRVGNWSPLAAATLEVPVGDEEEDFEEFTDDDLPEEEAEAPLASASSTRGERAAGAQVEDDPASTLSIRAVTASDRRAAALDDVRAACVRHRPKGGCYRAVEDACRVGGICTRAKAIACEQVRLYCTKAMASRESLFGRYQPNFRMATYDRFYPVSFNTALNLRWDGRSTTLVKDDDIIATGAREIRPRLRAMTRTDDDLFLDFPAGRNDVDDQFASMQQALGVRIADPYAHTSDDQWDPLYAASRIYWYRGGGFGTNPGPENTVKTLQYWTFHTYNYLPTPNGDVGKHEGDAEMVAVAMNRDNEPKYFFMSRHGMRYASRIPDRDEEATPHREAIRMLWKDDRLSKFGDRVNVFPAVGSHAMYNDCGKWKRDNVPDDYTPCDDGQLLNFNWMVTRRIPLGRAPWACWGGRLGRVGGGGLLHGDGPLAPLWQQATFRGDPHPCRDASASVAEAATARSATSRSAPAARASASRSSGRAAAAPRARSSAQAGGADPLVDQLSRCEHWYQSPGQPGAEVVACDQAQMDRYFASGLTDPGPGGARLDGPGGASNDVPAVYHSRDPRDLAKVTATGSGHATGIYASQFDADGTIREAVFAPVAIADGEQVRVRWHGQQARLVTTDGRVLATAPVKLDKAEPQRVVGRVRGVRVKVRGRRAVITFRRQRGVSVSVVAGRTRDLAGGRFLKASRPSARRVVVRLGRRDRWLQLYGTTKYSRGDAVKVRVRRR